jgi:signal transduction histidine kinase
MTRRSWIVYGVLLAAWGLILAWQVAEHKRVRQSERAKLIDRAKDISNTLGVVVRSQRHHFSGIAAKERLEAALDDLINPGELNAVALLNSIGEIVVSAGDPINFQGKGIRVGEHWESAAVTLINLVDLGTNVTHDLERYARTRVVPRQDLIRPPDTNRPPYPEPRPILAEEPQAAEGELASPPPRPRWRGSPDGRFRFEFRPPGMSDEEFHSLREKQSVHSFVIVLSTQSFLDAASRDLWLRTIIGVLATISMLGLALAWRNLMMSSELQIRLVRASELNLHLKEMNLAAAGLAHETRNPLNIIRGLAQLITKQESASPEVRKKSRDILNETDRVTAQLNEFINYSRPREVRPATVDLKAVVGEVVHALSYDIDEKQIALKAFSDSIFIQADEPLLRQALFNLLLNAIQAVAPGGEIQINASSNGSGVALEISDNGPGVLEKDRCEIFKPYFTTHQQGTGLGLAVVQQIVLAHGWEINCLSNEPRGALFRISHVKIASKP